MSVLLQENFNPLLLDITLDLGDVPRTSGRIIYDSYSGFEFELERPLLVQNVPFNQGEQYVDEPEMDFISASGQSFEGWRIYIYWHSQYFVKGTRRFLISQL